KTSACNKGAEPAVEGWDTGGSPCTLKDSPPPLQVTQHPQSSTDHPTHFCHSFGTFYCRTLPAHCKELPALPPDTQSCPFGSAAASGTEGTFPSLSAEPRLTWCCLSRSLPLPAEQKGSAHSAYSSGHCWDRGADPECPLAKCDSSVFNGKNSSKIGAHGLTNTALKTPAPSFPKGQQMQELSSAAPGGAFKSISEQKKKTVVC
ncbi:ZN831 protein, partial [Formicarius rufipectus]|nr:ZN831 protein [Formicarius rufipectus]